MISNLENIMCILNPYGIKRKENVNQITLYVALKDYTNSSAGDIKNKSCWWWNSAQLELVLQ